MADLKESPSQTAGPYVHIGCVPQTAGLERRGTGVQLGAKMVHDADLPAMSLDIVVLDGSDDPVRDALIEIWQADRDGSYAPTDGFTNWGRQATDLQDGVARFTTLKPGAVDGHAPHILIWIVARGINLALTTRVYFPEDDHAGDPVLRLAGDRAGTLIAEAVDGGYRHVIHLQGPNETVFFDV